MPPELPKRVGAVSRPESAERVRHITGDLEAVLDWTCIVRAADLYDLDTGRFVARAELGLIVSLTP